MTYLCIMLMFLFTFFINSFPVKPKFTDRKMKSFMVVRTGHSVRANIQFEV